MSPNVSLSHITKNEQAETVDIDAIMDNVTIVLYTLTVVLGITGNTLVIWVAGFKLKVDTVSNEFLLISVGSLFYQLYQVW